MPLDGVLALDKPTGVTSHDVVQQLRRLSGQRRIGHTGTLDPLATGLLLLCFGRSTRFVEYLMDRPKEYVATIRLGQATDSYDADGAVVAEYPVDVTRSNIERALASFRGTIQQEAPIYSAIKRGGTPLYKLARRGQDVERPSRQVTFHEITLIAWQKPDLTLLLRCSPGTYVRSLAHDLGEALGCGGHIAALRRTASGAITVAQALPPAVLTAAALPERLIPGHAAVAHLPRLVFAAPEAARLLMGQTVPASEACPMLTLPDDFPARAYSPDDLFLGLVIVRDGFWQPHKMFRKSLDEPI